MHPIRELESLTSDPTQLDLDLLRLALAATREAWDAREQLLNLYQDELQRELRAKVELCGGIPACQNPDLIPSLNGPALLAARREASHQFNQTFFIMPLSRAAQKPNPVEPNSRPHTINTPERARS
jgi:hypothetical protein